MLLAEIAIVDDVRSAERRELAEQTTLRLDERPCSVGVFNLSATGCLVRAEFPLAQGTEVRIGLPGVGAFAAEVVRTDGLRAGCRFQQPLTSVQLADAFRHEVVVEGQWELEPQALELGQGAELSPRIRLAIIVGITCGLWGCIALGLNHFI